MPSLSGRPPYEPSSTSIVIQYDPSGYQPLMYMPFNWALLPAVIRPGITGESACRIKSATRLIGLKRICVAAGNFGLNVDPSGAITVIGRKAPELAGMYCSVMAASRSSVLKRL